MKQAGKRAFKQMLRQRSMRTQRGGTLLGFLAGLITGLVVAVAVALYISKAPVPFGSKTVRQDPLPNPIGNKALQDPNLSLYPKQSAPGTDVPLFKPETDVKKLEAAEKSLDKVIEKVTEKTSEKPAAEPSLTLQVGAYKNQEDAENMKARLALMGVEGKVSSVEVDGKPLYRVRVSYQQPEELQIGRKRLNDNGIENTLVKSK